ncbi:MAG: LPS export ABC transporter periplasmic protein LptC [Arenicellales bacterium]|nr:LPS export ABC transporter periplasmic protein LptC [Arenicellales bacterium]
MFKHLERIVLLGVLCVMAGLVVWLHEYDPVDQVEQLQLPATHDADYIIQDFTATGRDAAGVAYVLKAERLEHLPQDNTSLLDRPHLQQYQNQEQYQSHQPFRDIRSQSGRLSSDGSEVLLTGAVEVKQRASTSDPGSITRTEQMTVQLKRETGN